MKYADNVFRTPLTNFSLSAHETRIVWDKARGICYYNDGLLHVQIYLTKSVTPFTPFAFGCFMNFIPGKFRNGSYVKALPKQNDKKSFSLLLTILFRSKCESAFKYHKHKRNLRWVLTKTVFNLPIYNCLFSRIIS